MLRPMAPCLEQPRAGSVFGLYCDTQSPGPPHLYDDWYLPALGLFYSCASTASIKDYQEW